MVKTMPNHIQSNIQSPQDSDGIIAQVADLTAAPPAAAYLILNIALIDFGSASFSNAEHIFRISWKLLSLLSIYYIYSFINAIIQVCGYKCGSLMLWCLVLSTHFFLSWFCRAQRLLEAGVCSRPTAELDSYFEFATAAEWWSWGRLTI